MSVEAKTRLYLFDLPALALPSLRAERSNPDSATLPDVALPWFTSLRA
jgi:hypothetical protein